MNETEHLLGFERTREGFEPSLPYSGKSVFETAVPPALSLEFLGFGACREFRLHSGLHSRGGNHPCGVSTGVRREHRPGQSCRD